MSPSKYLMVLIFATKINCVHQFDVPFLKGDEYYHSANIFANEMQYEMKCVATF
jgi:hypothetical protein